MTSSFPAHHRGARGALWLSVVVLVGSSVLLAAAWPHDSLWYDEALTAYVANHSWETLWQWVTQVDIQVPFHYLVLRAWTSLAGDSEFMLRAVSALSVLLAVAGIIACGRRLVRRGGLGQAAGLLLGLSPGILWIAHEVRAYALAVALYAWATAFLLAILGAFPERPPSRLWPRLVGYILLMLAALYTHYTALAAFAAHLLIVAAVMLAGPVRRFDRRRIALLAAPLLLVGLGFLPWLPVMLARGAADRSYFEGTLQPEYAVEVMAGFKVLGRQDAPAVAIPLIIGYGALIGWGGLAGLAGARSRRAAWIALLLALTPLAITVALLTVSPKLTGRYFWPAWPGLDLLAALAVLLVVRWRAGLALLLTAALAVIPWLTGERGRSPESDYRAAFAFICTAGTPDDVILLRDGTLFVTAAYYGRRPPCDAPRLTIGMPPALITDVTRALSLAETQAAMAELAQRRPPNVWIIEWQGDTMDPQALSYALLDSAAAHTITAQMYGDVRLDRYERIDYEALARAATHGPLPEAAWFNLKPVPDGPTLVAARMFAPQVARAGDRIVLHAWWERGEKLVPDLRASARITTLDHGWIYTQIDQPPAGWKYVDDRWLPGIPALGRYELIVGPDVPSGRVAVRYVLYDVQGRWEPVVVTLGEVRIEAGP